MAESPWNPDMFASDLTAALNALIDRDPGESGLTAAVRESAAAAEARCSGRSMACAAGCPHCCVLGVAALLPEAMVIAEWMRETLKSADLVEVRQRLSTHRSWGRWMEDEERIARHVPCPLLDGAGRCLIHPVRPLLCRAVTSLDSGRCREALRPGISEESRFVVTDLLRQAAYDAAFTSLAGVLRKHGFDHRSIDVGAGVLGFLERPEYREALLEGRKLSDELWR